VRHPKANRPFLDKLNIKTLKTERVFPVVV